jgi:hypothetical protein
MIQLSRRSAMMRGLFTAGAAGLFLAIGATGAAPQDFPFRPALDGIGNAMPPASESAQIPDDIGFGAAGDRGAPRPHGRVIIESGAPTPVNGQWRHRRMWEIER